MKEKKNIDRLFQEKFRNFEVQPDEKVWEGINARRKKRRSAVVPLWLKAGATAAAVILILLLADLPVFSDNPSEETLVEQQNQSEEQNGKPELGVPDVPERIADQNNIVESQNSQRTIENASQTQFKNKGVTRPVSGVAQTTSPKNRQTGTLAETNVLQPKKTSSSTEETFASAKQESALRDGNSGADPLFSKTEEPSQLTEQAYAALESPEENSESTDAADLSLEEIAALKEPGLADEKVENKSMKRWALSPMIAPVYYSSFGGSGIDPQFNDNKKTGDVNFSYGLQVSYAVSEKLKLRSGVNKVDLGYNTEQVAFSTSLQALSISSINNSENSDIIQVADAGSRSFAVSGSEINTPKTNYNASLSQRLGYIEIPLEAEYTLIDKRFGIQIIGGLSSLFLSDNEIYVTDGNFRTLLGESNSLNSTSFSTNIGLGMDYHINSSMRFNLEPLFKYQLNAYSNTVSGFRPYYLGLYTGLSIQF